MIGSESISLHRDVERFFGGIELDDDLIEIISRSDSMGPTHALNLFRQRIQPSRPRGLQRSDRPSHRSPDS